MQKQQRGPITRDGHREWILDTKLRKSPPLELIRQISGLRIEQARAELIEQRLQEWSGLGSAAPTRASSKAPGVTAKGR